MIMSNRKKVKLVEQCIHHQPQVLLTKRSFGADLPSTVVGGSPTQVDSDADESRAQFTFYAQATESPTKIQIKRQKLLKENRQPVSSSSSSVSSGRDSLADLPEALEHASASHGSPSVSSPIAKSRTRPIRAARSAGDPVKYKETPSPVPANTEGTINALGTPKKRGPPPKRTPLTTPNSKKSTLKTPSKTPQSRKTTLKTPKSLDTSINTPKRTTTSVMETKNSTPRRTPQRNVASTRKSSAKTLLRTPRANITPIRMLRTPNRAKKSLHYINESFSDESESDEPSDIDLDDDIEDEDFDPKRIIYQKMATWSDSDEFETPRKRMKRDLINQTPVAKTPKSTKKCIMTPNMPKRANSLSSDLSPIQEAQIRLHVSAVPDSLPCRENEFAEIFSFTEAKIQEQTGGCMYISGWPGTGKTATVMEVIRTLKSAVTQGELEEFQFIELNAMRLTEPNQAYVQLWKKLTGEKVTSDHALALLERRFSRTNRQTTVLLIDELDMLCNKRQSVLYNLFDWPTRSSSKLVVLAVANAMDLPERVMITRVSSRLGLTRLTFSPYTFQQLQEIVSTRLTGLKIFDKNALQIVSRKVASLSGDARRALDICRRATEIARRDAKKGAPVLVEIPHVMSAHEEMFSSPKIVAIRSCSAYEKMFLRGIIQAFQKSGLEETQFERVFQNVKEQLNYENLPLINGTQGYAILNRLAACKIVISEPGKLGIHLRIRLNVSQDDVLFALDSGKIKHR